MQLHADPGVNTLYTKPHPPQTWSYTGRWVMLTGR